MDQIASSPCMSNIDSLSGNVFLLLLNTLLASQCALRNKDLYPADGGPKIKNGDHYDFIVVGAGSSGSVVGSRLAKHGKWNILVLETGDIPSVTVEIPMFCLDIQKTKEARIFYTEPSNRSCQGTTNGSCTFPRGNVLGGCSSINSMVYIRGNPKDYNEWARNGNNGWDHDNVMKYFKMSEGSIATELKNIDSYGKSGILPLTKYSLNETIRDVILESARDMNLEILQEDGKLGFMESPQTSRDGVRSNAAKVFLGSVKDSEKLTMALNAHVTKIIVDQMTAKGVELQLGGRSIKIFVDKEVILSAGALNSPQLLMLSGIGPREHLEKVDIEVLKDLRVGENLQDHLKFLMFTQVSDEAIKIKSEGEELDEIYKYFSHRQGELGTVGLANIQGFINTKNDSNYPDIQFTYVGIPKGKPFIETYMKMHNINEEITRNIIRMSGESNILMTLIILLKPKSRGTVLLKSKNPYENVQIHTGYLTDKANEDLETLLKGVRFTQSQMKTASFQKVKPKILDIGIPNCEHLNFDSDDYWRCAIRNIAGTLYHLTSTCKMGPESDGNAVVDSRLRIHGVNNLRVIDASIMPDIMSGNTNAPCIMIGQKGAEMIIDDHSDHHIEL